MTEPKEESGPAQAGRLPVIGALLAVIYGVAGAAFYLYSGTAEELISPRFGFLLVALTSIPLGLYMFIALIFGFRWPRATSRWLIIAGVTVSYLFIALGYRLDGALTEETMARGDALVSDLEDFRRATGAYPASLDDIASGGRALPVPALEGAAFDYQPTGDGGYVIAFPSVAFMVCSRSTNNPVWVCED